MSYNILQTVAATFKDIKVCVNLAQPFTHVHMYTFVRPRPHIVMHKKHCQARLTLASQHGSPALCAVQEKSYIQLVLGPIHNSTSFVLPASQCMRFTKASLIQPPSTPHTQPVMFMKAPCRNLRSPLCVAS